MLGGPQVAIIAWLNDIYRFGGGRFFDVMQFHDYVGQILADAKQVQGVLRSHGQARKPIWLGEYGLMEAGMNDPQQQALIQLVLTQKAPIALAAWYALRDDHVMTCCPPATIKEEPYGLMTDRYVPKGAFETMRNLLSGRLR